MSVTSHHATGRIPRIKATILQSPRVVFGKSRSASSWNWDDSEKASLLWPCSWCLRSFWVSFIYDKHETCTPLLSAWLWVTFTSTLWTTSAIDFDKELGMPGSAISPLKIFRRSLHVIVLHREGDWCPESSDLRKYLCDLRFIELPGEFRCYLSDHSYRLL